MKYAILIMLFLLVLVVTGCGSPTGNVPRAPPQPSGGGCGVAAPAVIENTDFVERATTEDKQLTF